jgi:hypothetical protein
MKRTVMAEVISPGSSADDGRVVASMSPDGSVWMEFDGWLQDLDGAYFPARRGSRTTDPTQLVFVCEALATGAERLIERTVNGRAWTLRWTFEAPRDFPQPSVPRDQRLWFLPAGADWFAFSMRAGAMLAALPTELGWLLSRMLSDHPDRPKLELCLVLLDEAMARLG